MTRLQNNNVEATASLVKRSDGWHLQFTFDDGNAAESDQAWETSTEAQSVLDAWCEANGVESIRAQ